MSVFRSLESKLQNLVEGTFSRAFKSEVRPVEIARKLAREMEEHTSHSVSRTYAPNEYTVYLSPAAPSEGLRGGLQSARAGHLLDHARREGPALVSRPVIPSRRDARLRLGEFGIQTRLVQPPDAPHAPPRRDDAPSPGGAGHTMV